MKNISVKLDEKTIVVKKLPLRKYVDLLKVLNKLPEQLSSFTDLPKDEVFAKLPALIADFLPEVVSMLTIATDLTKDEIDEMGLIEVTDVVVAVIEVNRFPEVFEKLKKAVARPATKN